jgi:hypothetical protein
MKAASLLLAIVWLCSCKTQPKTITVAFNGSRGRDFLSQGCAVLQRDYDHVRQFPAKDQFWENRHSGRDLWEQVAPGQKARAEISQPAKENDELFRTLFLGEHWANI